MTLLALRILLLLLFVAGSSLGFVAVTLRIFQRMRSQTPLQPARFGTTWNPVNVPNVRTTVYIIRKVFYMTNGNICIFIKP